MKERILNTKTVKGVRRFASIVMLGLVFSGCGETTLTAPYPQTIPGSTGNSSGSTNTGAINPGTFNITPGTCMEVGPNTVIGGDVSANGTNLFDTGPGSQDTGLVLLTTASADVCAPNGASGAVFSNATDAQNYANWRRSNMLVNGCENGCSGGVFIKDQNNNVIRR